MKSVSEGCQGVINVGECIVKYLENPKILLQEVKESKEKEWKENEENEDKDDEYQSIQNLLD